MIESGGMGLLGRRKKESAGYAVFRKVDKTFWCPGRETGGTRACKLCAKNKYGTGCKLYTIVDC